MPFRHINTWIFDLDNTLYQGEAQILDRVHDQINLFIMNMFGITREEAEIKRQGFYKKYGTTLRGLMTEHGIAPDDYLDYVHKIDISGLPRCNVTAEKLKRLPGRKIIYTNAAHTHADRVLGHLGIDCLFEGVYDIKAAQYLPKPDPRPYARLIELYGINPKTACMVEDLAKNLVPAASCGMTTLWISGPPPHEEEPPSNTVHHRATTLKEWLERHV